MMSLSKAVMRQIEVGVFGMPLSKAVDFKTVLQRGNRVQLPKLVRWQFKMETTQVLKVSVKPANSFCDWESFFARMNRDGRLTIPKLTLVLMQKAANGGKSLTGYVLEVKVKPAEAVT